MNFSEFFEIRLLDFYKYSYSSKNEKAEPFVYGRNFLDEKTGSGSFSMREADIWLSGNTIYISALPSLDKKIVKKLCNVLNCKEILSRINHNKINLSVNIIASGRYNKADVQNIQALIQSEIETMGISVPVPFSIFP